MCSQAKQPPNSTATHPSPLSPSTHTQVLCYDANGALSAHLRVNVIAGSAVSCMLSRDNTLVNTPLLAAQWISFDLEACDAHGNALVGPGAARLLKEAPLPTIKCGACVPSHAPKITRRLPSEAGGGGIGGWEVHLMPAVSGSHPLHISIGSVKAAGSPYTLDVRPGVVHAKRCTAEGEGLSLALPLVASCFTVEARDVFGNRLTRGV